MPQVLIKSYVSPNLSAYKWQKGWQKQLDIAKVYLNKASKKMKKRVNKDRRLLKLSNQKQVIVKLPL